MAIKANLKGAARSTSGAGGAKCCGSPGGGACLFWRDANTVHLCARAYNLRSLGSRLIECANERRRRPGQLSIN